MGFFLPKRPSSRAVSATNEFIPSRSTGWGAPTVTGKGALAHSAVWACVRVRADMVSSLPLRVFRDRDKIPVSVPSPDFLLWPGGTADEAMTGASNVTMREFLYSSQVSLDLCGNAFGVVTSRTALGGPRTIELVDAESVSFTAIGPKIVEYRIGRDTFAPRDVWHERQYSLPGNPLGLSPVTAGALSIAGFQAAQEFGLDFFRSGAAPSVIIKNNENATVSDGMAAQVKERWRAAISGRGAVVLGAQWEASMMDISQASGAFIEEMNFGVTDVCRFMGVPADLVDSTGAASNVTYANVSQRNQQFLNTHLAPVLGRREDALSNAIPGEYYVRFDRSELLAMDPEAQARARVMEVGGRVLTPTEARALAGRPPLTAADVAEFDILPKSSAGSK